MLVKFLPLACLALFLLLSTVSYQRLFFFQHNVGSNHLYYGIWEAHDPPYSLEVGAFTIRQNAEKLKVMLTRQGIPSEVRLVERGASYRLHLVQIGPILSREKLDYYLGSSALKNLSPRVIGPSELELSTFLN